MSGRARGIMVFLLVASCSLLQLGWTNDWWQIGQAMEAVQSLQSPFTQEKHLKILTKPLISKGSFYYRAPDNLRWEYHSPIRNALLMYQGNITRYAEQNGKIVQESGQRLEALRIVMERIAQWMSGSFENDTTFKATLIKDDPPCIELTPKEDGLAKMIARVRLTLAKQPGVIERIEIIESEQARTVLIFTAPKVNPKLSDATFKRYP